MRCVLHGSRGIDVEMLANSPPFGVWLSRFVLTNGSVMPYAHPTRQMPHMVNVIGLTVDLGARPILPPPVLNLP